VQSITKVHVARDVNKRGRLVGADFTMMVFAEDVLIARATAKGKVATAEKYKIARVTGREALLARNPPPATPITPIDPGLVGMRPGSSTLIGELTAGSEPGRFGGMVRVDADDLFYYDHPVSHVPGVVTCEALRQAAVVAACRSHPGLSPNETMVHKFDAKFAGYSEPDIDIDIVVTLGEASDGELGTMVPVEGVVTQLGKPIVSAHFELEFASL
jgi:hypothetical protein